MVFCDCCGDLGFKARDFDDNVYLITYGDDNVCNISSNVVDVFNQNSVIRGMSRYGLTYTSEKKDEVDVPSYR